jgi:predicted DCC family thiol-disulfide oxidoreductase YuxK
MTTPSAMMKDVSTSDSSIISQHHLQQQQQGGRGGGVGTTSTEERRLELFKEDINILYDSKCNVCQLEINFLRKLDVRLHGEDGTKLKFTDLEGSDYDCTDPINGKIDYARGMKAMHGILPNGKVLEGVPVFVVAYKAVNLGWLFGMYNVAPLRWVLDRGYDVFARYRTNITRGTSVSELVQSYQEKRELFEAQQKGECETCATKIPR